MSLSLSIYIYIYIYICTYIYIYTHIILVYLKGAEGGAPLSCRFKPVIQTNHICYHKSDFVQGSFRKETGIKSTSHQGRYRGHTMKGHENIF